MVTSEEITITVTNPPGNMAPTVQALADPKTGTAPLRGDVHVGVERSGR